MSQIVRYRQHWMATLKDRHTCHICGLLAVNAKYLTNENEVVQKLKWLCDHHLNTFSHLQQGF
jgi:hypothetical protein